MLVSQRIKMNFILAVNGSLLGILAVFMVWALQWVLESRKEVTFDMPGEVTSLTVMEGSEIVAGDDVALAHRELMNYFRDEALVLVVSSATLSYPEMMVYDPHDLLPWFPGTTAAEGLPFEAEASGVYLFKGTYTERRWSESTVAPLLPKWATVDGVISAPSGVGGLQWARRFGQEPLAPALYYINFNTVDPSQVRHIVDLLHRMGFTLQQTLKIPLLGYLISNPLLVITVFFLAMGHVCTMLYWFYYHRGRAHEFTVRSSCGAEPPRLVWENLTGAMPGLLAGITVGVILSGLLVTMIGHIALTQEILQILAVAGFISAISIIATWSAALYAALALGRIRR